MKLPKKLRHWLIFKLADLEFTTRSGWRNDEDVYVIRAGCLQKLISAATIATPSCGNLDCFQGRNAWHTAECTKNPRMAE